VWVFFIYILRICGNNDEIIKYDTTQDGTANIMMLIFDSRKVKDASAGEGFKVKVSSFGSSKYLLHLPI